MKKKEKNPNRLRFKDYFGTTIMAATGGISAGLMTTWFMVYLTDYAGLGKWGAILGSTVLLGARLFDAVNDPLEGWIMDRAKVGRFGKYKPFIILSLLLITIGVSGLFFIPEGVNQNIVTVSLWIIVSYLIYDIGVAFHAPNLIYRSMTLDGNERGKLLIGPRMVIMLFGMAASSLINIVNSVNESVNNMHLAFGITVVGTTLICGVISLLGISMVKEKYHAPQSEDDERIKLTDIFKVIKDNKALRIRLLEAIFSGFIWTFLFATALYYIKWAYCADLTTGAVDSDTYGLYSLITAMMMFLPLVVGTFIATPLMKRFGSAVRFHRFLVLMQAIPCGLLFVFHLLGLLSSSPALFFVCMAITAIAIGADYIPMGTMNIECMDYEIYTSGKDRSALCNACFGFMDKAQSAVSSGLIGVILVAIGYVVDSETDTYIGDLANIPTLLTWFIVIMGIVPCVLGIISWFILKHYPVTDEVRADMNKKLSE